MKNLCTNLLLQLCIEELESIYAEQILPEQVEATNHRNPGGVRIALATVPGQNTRITFPAEVGTPGSLFFMDRPATIANAVVPPGSGDLHRIATPTS